MQISNLAKVKELLTIVALILLTNVAVQAQVSIAPTALFVDADSRSCSMFVNNPTDHDVEVEISLIFGYSANDSTGKSYIEYNDSLMAEKYSLYPYITAFPKKFIIKPKAQQTIRFVLKNTSKLPDGIYWSRIRTESGKIQEQLDSQNVNGVSVKVNMRMAMVTAVFYKKGNTDNTTKISVGQLSTREDTSKIYLVYDLSKQGDFPFFGTAKFTITNESGKEVSAKEESFSLYKSALKAFEFEKKDFPAGKYKVELKLINENKIFPKEYLPKTSEVKNTQQIEIK
jgi:P pilus assembly chaperone PapD